MFQRRLIFKCMIHQCAPSAGGPTPPLVHSKWRVVQRLGGQLSCFKYGVRAILIAEGSGKKTESTPTAVHRGPVGPTETRSGLRGMKVGGYPGGCGRGLPRSVNHSSQGAPVLDKYISKGGAGGRGARALAG